MPYDPNEFETGEGQEDSLTVEDEELPIEAVQQLATQLTSPQAPKDEELDMSYLQDVEQRLEVASCYRLLTKNSLFEDRTPATNIVEKEVRAFIRERLASLLNLKGNNPVEPQKAEGQFSDLEVKLLKVWAAALAKRPNMVDSVTQPAGKKPAVRKQTSPGIRPVAATKPAPVAAVPATAPAAPASTTPVTAQTGQRRLRRAQYKPLVDSDGVPIIDKKTGEQMRKNVTPQVVGSGMIPMPTDMTTATAMKAQQIIQANENMALGTDIAAGKLPITSTTGEE